MPRVKFKILGSLHPATGRQLEFDLPAKTTVGQMLAKIIGQGFMQSLGSLEQKREIDSRLYIFINGQEIRHLNGFDTVLGEGDEIFLVPGDIAGGC
jgi:molybdopterin converting factor small subunit